MSTISGPITGYIPSSSTLATDTSKIDYKMEFLKLMMTSLKNQDPSDPMDSKEMLSQQAQFASLEQMQNLNTNFVTLMAMQNVSQATNLIGRNVTGNINSVATSGQVTGISFVEGKTMLNVKVSATESVIMNLVDITQVSL